MSQGVTAGKLLGFGETAAVIAFVGCGGKTTFIERLAREYVHKKVLVTPTTKIRPMTDGDIVLCTSEQECAAHMPRVGIQCMGELDESIGKLKALAPVLLERILWRHDIMQPEVIPKVRECESLRPAQRAYATKPVADRPPPRSGQIAKHFGFAAYDLALLEADGSRGMPCKGWMEDEPVIPVYCTHTVGIVTLNAFDRAADEETVLHLPEFLTMTGLSSGGTITLDTLCRMLCAPHGMFKNSTGSRYVFINQVESDEQVALARKLIELIQKTAPEYFVGFGYGSAWSNQWTGV